MSEHTSNSVSQKTSKTCSICLGNIRKKGNIDTCDHPFCFQCIQQWSKIENTCPICKRRFKEIQEGRRSKHEASQTRKKKVKVAKISNQNQEDRHYEVFLQDIEPGFTENLPGEYVFLNQLIFQGIQEIPFSDPLDEDDLPAESQSS